MYKCTYIHIFLYIYRYMCIYIHIYLCICIYMNVWIVVVRRVEQREDRGVEERLL